MEVENAPVEEGEKPVKQSSLSIPIIVLFGIIIVLAIAVGILLNKTCPESFGACNITTTTCPKCPTTNQGNLNLLYLVPVNCTTCDFQMMQNVMNDLGIKITPYVTDKVLTPMVFIGSNNTATLALANSRYNVLTAICEFANYRTACSLRDRTNVSEGGVSACLSKYNISAKSIIFFHSTTCPHCARMMPWVRNLENESYDFTWIEASDSEKMRIVKDCLVTVLDTAGYVPQFACPLTKELRVGAFASIEQMKEFADKCRNATAAK